MKKRRPKLREDFGPMCRAVERYLKAHGWYMVVSGPATIEHDPLEKKFAHRFVLTFVGGKRRAAGEGR